jgi:hypothetical protein
MLALDYRWMLSAGDFRVKSATLSGDWSMHPPNLNTPLIRNPRLIATGMDSESVMMSIERGNYYGIGGVGLRVWDIFEHPATIAEIALTICAEYDADQAACQADLRAFAGNLIKNGLVSGG